MSSSFSYGENNFIQSMTTPYGTTTFRHEGDPQNANNFRRIEATNPVGATERLEFWWQNASLPATVTAGATTIRLPAIVVMLCIACGDQAALSREAINLARSQVTSFRQPRLVQLGPQGMIEFDTVYLTNEERIRQELQNVKGEVSITGWTTRRIERNVFLAIYEAKVNGEEKKYAFEVNLNGRLVRNVADDAVLAQKYSDTIWR